MKSTLLNQVALVTIFALTNEVSPAALGQEFVLVADGDGNKIVRFRADSGLPFDHFVGAGLTPLDEPRGMTIGPDALLYAVSSDEDEVIRYDPQTGELVDVFITADLGGLSDPQEIIFTSEGNLLVSSYTNNLVRLFDGVTGLQIDDFIVPGAGGLDRPVGLAYGPDGNLYVSSFETNQILRYDGDTGDFIDVFIPNPGLDGPSEILFHNDRLYVASYFGDSVLAYDANTGAFLDFAAPPHAGNLNGPHGLAIGPRDGLLYVTSRHTESVIRFDVDLLPGTADIFIERGGGGLVDPLGVLFVPETGTGCPGDVNDDGVVNVDDIFAILGMWGPCE